LFCLGGTIWNSGYADLKKAVSDISKMLAAAHEMKRQFDEMFFRANVQDSGEERVSATLCLTIAEQFAAALHLIDGGFSSHAPIIVRSMLEGLASLLNLVNDPRYLDQMRFDNARSNIILFDEYAADPGMQDNKEALSTLASWKEQDEPIRDDLVAKGFKRQDVIEKFKKANILENYVAYRVFCSFAHNQLTTLIARHAGHFELRNHSEAPAELIVGLLNVAASILCQSVVTISNYTDLSEEEVQRAVDAADVAWTIAVS
jgi:hypothetical protein